MSPHQRLELAKHLQQQGSWLAAAAAYAELAALVPSDHRFLANQANALWLADLPEAAHRCYRRGLALQPDCAISRRGLASAGLGTIACCLVLLGQLRGNLVFTLLLCGVLGVGSALLAIPAQTTIQEETPEELRGKVFGLQNNLINIALSLPLVLAGAVVSRYGLLPVLWALAGLALAAALLEKPWKRC